jgi:hypothetical protein
MRSQIVSWFLFILICLALIAALFIVIGFLADQTGEASTPSTPLRHFLKLKRSSYLAYHPLPASVRHQLD